MLDMTFTKNDSQYFITDIEVKDGKIFITRADGTVSEEKFSEHNLGFYRMQMIKYADENINDFLDDLAKDSFMTFVKKYGAVILGVVSLYFLYNFDIHIIIKILITILIGLGEIAYYIVNKLYLILLNDQIIEAWTIESYLKNLNVLRYYDDEAFTDNYVIPPEEIGKSILNKEQLEKLVEGIKLHREQGMNPKQMKLTYEIQPENGKSML